MASKGSRAENVRRLYSELRALDLHELRRVLIFVRGILIARGDRAGGEPDEIDERVTYRLETVRCGKSDCSSCPHGPYWYAYFREGNRLRSRYIGSELPESVRRRLSE
jgi:hypothetical protein